MNKNGTLVHRGIEKHSHGWKVRNPKIDEEKILKSLVWQKDYFWVC